MWSLFIDFFVLVMESPFIFHQVVFGVNSANTVLNYIAYEHL